MNVKHLLTVLSLLVILGIVLFLPRLINNPSHQSDVKVSNVDCELNRGECTYHSSIYGDLSISVSPKTFTALTPLAVSITSDSSDILNAVVNLDGKDMFMGLNQSILTQAGKGRWEGVITIPVCTVDAEMAWLFSVTLKGLEAERLVFNIKSKH